MVREKFSVMKIISWNCNGAFRNKYKFIEEYQPDIVVAQESESPEFLNVHKKNISCDSHVWDGELDFKGVSVFTFHGYKASIADFYKREFKYVLPVEIVNRDKKFLLMAVWTKFVGKFKDSYVAQAYNAVCNYEKYFDNDTVIIGDFNSNSIWNNSLRRRVNHDTLVKRLDDDKFISIYHQLQKEKQGSETVSTLYQNKKQGHGYHIDYAFLHRNMLADVNDFKIGNYNDWYMASDHMPLFLEIKNKRY